MSCMTFFRNKFQQWISWWNSIGADKEFKCDLCRRERSMKHYTMGQDFLSAIVACDECSIKALKSLHASNEEAEWNTVNKGTALDDLD